jgi:cytosine/adenosine deaminase-related metal-dependent hydrolase
MYGVMQQVRSGTTTLMLNAGGSRATIDATLRAFEEIGPRVAYSASFSSQSALIYGDDDAFIASLPAELQTRVRAELMPPSRTPIGEYLARSLDLKRSYESARPGHVRILLAPSGYQWATEAELKQIAETAERENMGVHTHIAETAYERVAAERTTGQTPVQRMQAVGLTGPKISFAHCAWINEADMDILAETGTSVSHNPGSNLRLHAGIAPVRDMLAHGVTVGLGTDNGGINDDDDMLQEIGLSQRLHRPPGLREQHVTADQLLHMATMGGAVTTTFGAEMIGSLEPGKQADLVLIDWDRVESPYLDPSVAPLDALVARARSRDVNTVMVGGRVVYQDGRFPGIDEDGIVGALRERLAGPVPPELEANRRLVEELEPHVVRFYDDWELPMGSSFERRNAR